MVLLKDPPPSHKATEIGTTVARMQACTEYQRSLEDKLTLFFRKLSYTSHRGVTVLVSFLFVSDADVWHKPRTKAFKLTAAKFKRRSLNASNSLASSTGQPPWLPAFKYASRAWM